jgi:hypothetical protein
MKLFQKLTIDERTRGNAGHAAGIILGITQILLAGVLFFRLYILGQPDSEVRDIQAVLAISIFGYIALQLYLGGMFPVPTPRGAVIVYLALMALVTGGCLLIYGVPPISDWTSTWLPALLGPAIVVGVYYFVAWLGRRRLERQIGN